MNIYILILILILVIKIAPVSCENWNFGTSLFFVGISKGGFLVEIWCFTIAKSV